jgi:hypothetical protein
MASNGMINTKFREDWFRYSSNSKIINRVMLEAAMFVSLMGGIYEI